MLRFHAVILLHRGSGRDGHRYGIVEGGGPGSDQDREARRSASISSMPSMPSLAHTATGPLVLAVDTSSAQGSVALARGSAVLAARTFGEGRSHSQLLLPAVAELFKETRLNVRDVDLFGAVIGPGSFTGLRVSLACVRGLAGASPCFGAVASDVAAWAARDRGTDVVALTDLFHGEIFGGVYSAAGDLVSARESGLFEPVVASLRSRSSAAPFLIGSAAARHQRELGRVFPEGVYLDLPEGLAPHLAHLASVKATESNTCQAGDLLPFYLRDPLTRALSPSAKTA